MAQSHIQTTNTGGLRSKPRQAFVEATRHGFIKLCLEAVDKATTEYSNSLKEAVDDTVVIASNECEREVVVSTNTQNSRITKEYFEKCRYLPGYLMDLMELRPGQSSGRLFVVHEYDKQGVRENEEKFLFIIDGLYTCCAAKKIQQLSLSRFGKTVNLMSDSSDTIARAVKDDCLNAGSTIFSGKEGERKPKYFVVSEVR